MRLDKYLADLQVGTRSQVKDYIRKGSVAVNGEIIKKPEYKLDEAKDIVSCAGETLVYQKYQYYMLHKPAGVVTATKDKYEKTVLDLLPDSLGKDLFPVGRLDKDTEGLLLITNDGGLAHNLLSPKKHVEKTYYAECAGSIAQSDILQLEQGVDIGDDALTQPAKVKLIAQEKDCYRLELTITEGRFHQVKRMITAVGGTVMYLKRLSMGTLILDERLPKGSYRELIIQEIEDLRQY